jgi:hypothetical protein
MSKTRLIAAIFVALAGAGPAAAITITFDPTQATPPGQSGPPPATQTPASTLSYWGITFHSSAANDPSICGGRGPLCFADTIGTAALGLNFLTDDILSGSLTGSPALTLTFLNPTTILDFGAVVGTSTSEPLSVSLFGPQFTGKSPVVINLQALNGASLSEGEFSYSGSPITGAVITFSSDGAPIFGIDNLTYNQQVPEPGAMALIGGGLICILGASASKLGSITKSLGALRFF